MRFICRMKNFISVILLLTILVIPYKTVSADCVKYNQKDIVVGLLSTEFVSYPNEYKTAKEITQLLQGYGVRVILMDYNVIMKLARDEIVKANETYEKSYKISRYDIIESVVARFIEQNNISRILIPGNYYNISSLPIAPSSHRQLITNAVVKVISKNQCIHLLGICGGLQGIMHANGIEITRVENMITSHPTVKSHVISMPNPRNVDANLHKIIISPGSRLSNIIGNLNNGLSKKQVVYFPDAHSEAINNHIENITKMYNLGYKIIALSEDGIIEGIEDKYGNIHLQFHPEYLMINGKEKSDGTDRNVSLLIADAIIKDFLFRD
ncbi:gamma-glutamyl-gamma-aminobutyrate hydrolase family protein [Ehrlichia sp. JZT12]